MSHDLIDVPLQSGQNALEFQGYNSDGEELTGMDDSITITYTGQ